MHGRVAGEDEIQVVGIVGRIDGHRGPARPEGRGDGEGGVVPVGCGLHGEVVHVEGVDDSVTQLGRVEHGHLGQIGEVDGAVTRLRLGKLEDNERVGLPGRPEYPDRAQRAAYVGRHDDGLPLPRHRRDVPAAHQGASAARQGKLHVEGTGCEESVIIETGVHRIQPPMISESGPGSSVGNMRPSRGGGVWSRKPCLA